MGVDLTTATISQWKMNDDYIDPNVDDSMDNNEGTLYDHPGVTVTTQVFSATSGEPPYLTKCLQMPLEDPNTEGGFIDIGTLGSFGSSMDAFSVSVWGRFKATGYHLGIIGVTNSGSTTRFTIILNRGVTIPPIKVGAIELYLCDDDSSVLRAAANYDTGITDDSWHHLVININKSEGSVEIYVDNADQSITYNTQGTGTNFSNFDVSVALGAWNESGTHDDFISPVYPDPYEAFPGYLDDFRIMNRELTEDEIAFLYNEGDGTEELLKTGIARPLVGGSLAVGRRGLV